MGYPGTDPKKLLHRVLIGPAAMESLPSWVIFFGLLMLAAGVGAAWDQHHSAVVVAAGWLIFALLDWVLLAALPRTRRSFGPVYPPLLGLALLRALLVISLALTTKLWLAAAVMLSTSLLAWYATWWEPFGIQVTQCQLTFDQWPAGSPALRLLHLGDLHLERESLREARLQEAIDRLQPDLICFSGDLLNLSYNDDPLAIAHARLVIKRWRAPLGVYAATGSPLVDLPETAEKILGDLPNIRWLQDEAITLQHNDQPLTLVGLTCTHNPEIDGAKLSTIMGSLPYDTPKVLIYHTPDLAPTAAAAGIDLQLSGHTHGGQIRLPFYGAVITSSIYRKRFEMGEYRLPKNEQETMTLYTSRGIGVEGGIAPRARFLCRPEIILWTLKGTSPPVQD